MIIIERAGEIREYLLASRKAKKNLRVGFVPTMGALHEGHLSLIRKSKKENSITICSIFVNPLQFNNTEDYEKYPRNHKKDTDLLSKADCDVVFIPQPEDVLPQEIDNTKQVGKKNVQEIMEYDLKGLDTYMEGRYRPGHFQGMVYIVKKLLEIIEPESAYFGKKDYQQLIIVKHIGEHYRIRTKIKGCPIVRDKSGLALSSRNERLDREQIKIAPSIYKTLTGLKQRYNKYTIKELKDWVKSEIEKSELMKLEYIEIVNRETLKPIQHKNSSKKIACIAVYLGNVRLIDNIFI